ncbi:hypothetical protein OAG1_20410 [Agarivorans sp. OAG1]|uniref:hypothetical protein n=1 Tax=Agarivorans sp. OAG1 TaxID=3082387 RepID=UPI002B2DC87A|nr:hypothetical protein OAG1_20410 [Agarivorans sp. OAG1]
MYGTQIKVTHFSIIVVVLLLWFYAVSGLIDAAGVDGAQETENAFSIADLAVPGAMVVTFVLALLMANIFSYIIIARVLKIPRNELEKVIKDRAANDPHENI